MFATAILIATAVAIDAPSLLVLFLVLVAGYLMLVRPFLGLLLLAATLPLEDLFVVGGVGTATKLVGIAVAITWFVGKVLRRESFYPVVSSGLFLMSSLFLAVVLASSLWAVEPTVVHSGFVQLVRLLVFALIAVDLLKSWARFEWLVRVLILSAAVAGALTIGQHLEGGIGRAGVGIMGVNAGAAVLVTLMPFAFFMMLYEEHRLWKLLGIAFVPIATGAIFVSFSRMNFLLLPLVLLALLWEPIRMKTGRPWLIAVIGGIAIAAATVVPWDRIWQRVDTIAPYLESSVQSGTDEAPTASSRGYILRVALVIFQDYPVLGVGYNHFGYHFLHTYQYQVPGKKRLSTTWRSPHSSHLGILADLGLVGFLPWIGILLISFRNLRRARSCAAGTRSLKQILLIRALTYGLLLHALPYAFYFPNQKTKIVWLLLGMTVVVKRLAETRNDPSPDGKKLAAAVPVPPQRAAVGANDGSRLPLSRGQFHRFGVGA